MTDIIKQIDIAWEQKTILFDIEPISKLGYFAFRNKVMIQYRQNL